MSDDGLIRLSDEQIKQVLDRGYTYVMLDNGMIVKATKEDLVFKKEEVEKLAEILQKEKQQRDSNIPVLQPGSGKTNTLDNG